MTDSEVVDRLRRIDALQSKLSDLIHEIEDSDHPKAAELTEDLYHQCWFAASAEHVGIKYLDKSRWSLEVYSGGHFGRIISRQHARKRGVRVMDIV